jgi:hypothetical protein
LDKFFSMPEAEGKMRMRCYIRYVFAIAALILLSGLTACQRNADSVKTSATSGTTWLQKAGNITVSFKGMMTFDFGDPTGTNFTTWATELSVPAVPITWMGNIFNGTITDSGSGYGLTDEVHGNVSADGLWVDQMTYSRRVVSQSGSSNFSVTLSDIPIIKNENGNTTILASFLKTGSDVQKHVVNINYTSGGSIGTTYKSTDWTDPNGVLKLELEFATGTGTRPKSGPYLGGGGM